MLEYAWWLGWSCFRSFMFAPRYCLSVGSLFMKISLKLLNTTILLENIDLHQIKTSEGCYEEKSLFIVVDICFHRWHVWVEVNHLLLLVTSLSWGQHHSSGLQHLTPTLQSRENIWDCSYFNSLVRHSQKAAEETRSIISKSYFSSSDHLDVNC